jgi:uncharacterized MnhB-related membrane protein
VDALLIVHVAATWFLTGLIWFVQIVHYPLMAGVGRPGFAAYEAEHARRTSWVVIAPMVVEAATAVALVVLPAPDVPLVQAWIGLALVAAVWLSTALLQVPRHRELHGGFDARAHARLVASNWIRMFAWTARSILVATWLA